MIKKRLFFGLCSCLPFLGFSQEHKEAPIVEQLEEVVITNSKFELKRENSGKVITKISQKELISLPGKSIAEIINTTAGIEINGTKSNAGQNLSYFIRGGRNRQVLILIDGIALSDASQIGNDYDLRLLNVDQVESIEILKGASSTLYGSGAATAVINITLKKATKKTISGNFRSVFGSNQSQNDNNFAIEDFRNSVNINGTLNKFTYLASFGNQYTNGLSSVESGKEKDAFNAVNGNLKLGYELSNSFKVNVYGSWDKFKADFDDSFMQLDADNRSTSEQYRLGISSKFMYNKGSININAASNRIDRQIDSSFPNNFKAQSLTMDAFNKYVIKERFYTVVGLNFQENKMDSYLIPFDETSLQQSIDRKTASFTIIDPYANVVYESDFGLNINTGIRLNNHSEYGSNFVYSINPSYTKSTKYGYLKGLVSYSTAYITPSLYQLFEPTYGNTELNPEENYTFEIGAEVNFTDKAIFSLVYFNRKENNFIDFVDLGGFVFLYKNVDKEFTASGVEFAADYKLSSKLKFIINATYTKIDEELNLRIPEYKVNAGMNYQISDQSLVSLSYQFNDDRKDVVFNNLTFINDSVILKRYSLLDLFISTKVMDDKIMLFANITNIFNAEFQELFGYSTRGRNVNLGFNLTL
ncbi:MAG: TonB-dependent receptor plug domain-containing protein [Bacteroidia bacterium]|nr:TonB-dependent receptor plug domain-containing protein [Bacteroidia bacterium]